MEKDTLKVLWAAKTKYPNNWGIKSHSHDCYQLFYIYSGSCRYTVDGESIEASKDDYILALPGVEHSMDKDHDGLVRMIDIKFRLNGTALARRLQEMRPYGPTPSVIQPFFKLISHEIKIQEAYYKEVIEKYTVILIMKLIASYESSLAPQIVTSLAEEDWPGVCRDIAEYIDTHYAQKVTLEDIAGALGYNKNYLCTTFKSETSMTIMDYLRRVRIERTCELIEMSDYTFSQICFMVGFKSIHHFNRIFKGIMEITPTEYKKGINERSSAVIQDTFKNIDNYDIT